MAPKIQAPLPPMLVNSNDNARRPEAPTSPVDQSPSISLTSVVKDALLRHFGSLKAAAIELKIDQGQLSRDLQTGDFKFKKLDGQDAVKRLIANAMVGAYGDDDPKARRRRVIRTLREQLDELAEMLEVA